MLEYTRHTEAIEKPSRLQLAIMEWQRQLVDKARMAHDEGQSNGNGGAAGDLTETQRAAKGFIAAARRDT